MATVDAGVKAEGASAATNGAADVPELIRLLEQQCAAYRRLRQLAERQRTLVVQDDLQPLLALLAERQALVDELMRVQAMLAPYRADWTSFFGELAAADKRRVTGLLEEANEALGGILQGDSRDSATLTARRQGTADQMASLGATARAAAAYSSAGRSSPGGGGADVAV